MSLHVIEWISYPYFLWRIFFTNLQMSGEKRAMATMKQTADIGLWKKMAKLPLEIIRDWRRFNSSMGPRTKARIRGATSYCNLRKK
jgi:hypothetical protein